ncbi:MAG: dihydroorotate dehydrogenase [Anaerovoracaceae bacterium]
MSDKIDMRVNIAGIEWKNPLTTASGTFSPRESGQFYDLNRLGAFTTKGVSVEPWMGNRTPRIGEVYGGMLNSVGLQNPGVDRFLLEEYPILKEIDAPIIVNVVGRTIQEYCKVAEILEESPIDMLEINISCPNVKEGGIGFGTDRDMAADVIRQVRKVTTKPIIVKLTPNVTDIADIARAVADAGADAISLINTLLGMKIDVYRKKPVLANLMGGFSGPAIKPVAVRMVYQVRQAVSLPIVGIGGIMTGEDAAEFLLAGADGVAVGTAALVDPTAPVRILEELETYMKNQGFSTIKQLKDAFDY